MLKPYIASYKFFEIKWRPRCPHTPWAVGEVKTQNQHLGRVFRINWQQKKTMSGLIKLKFLKLQATQKLSNAVFSR